MVTVLVLWRVVVLILMGVVLVVDGLVVLRLVVDGLVVDGVGSLVLTVVVVREFGRVLVVHILGDVVGDHVLLIVVRLLVVSVVLMMDSLVVLRLVVEVFMNGLVADRQTNVLVVGIGTVVVFLFVMNRKVVSGDFVLHLATKSDLGESKTDGVAELVEVLVLPLCLSIHDLVVDILAVQDKVMLDVENEVPGIGEGCRHLAELIKIRADGSLALFELVSDIVDNMSHFFDAMKDGVEVSVLKLVNHTT